MVSGVMMGIGFGELLLIAVIGLVVIALPVALVVVLVILLRRGKAKQS